MQALKLKQGQFAVYDDSFSEQLEAYRQALETLYRHFPTSASLENLLPPPGHTASAGARPGIDFDRWLVGAELSEYKAPHFPFGQTFSNHAQAREWAECIEGVTTIAVDGSQLQPSRDISIPVALIQVGFFANPHFRGRPYVKDVKMEVLTPDEIMEVSREEDADFNSYPYSETQVTLRRFELEVETIRELMERYARSRRPDDPVYSPLVFFDGSLVVSFALTMPSPYRERYIQGAVSLLQASETYRVPLIGYIDTSYARDIIIMLRQLDSNQEQHEPILKDTKNVHDALLWRGRLQWGDRTPAMLCARGDVLEEYGEYREQVAFCYLQTSISRPPARLEFPRWMLDTGVLEPIMDVVRAEVIAGSSGYPYAIETADAVAVISAPDRRDFYAQFQDFLERQGITLTFSRKSVSKGIRR